MRRFCAVLVGLVFFVAGVFKIIDPLGSSLVAGSYLSFLYLGFLSGLSGILGFALALIEALLGLAILNGVWKRLSARFTLILTGFFTVLTFLLLLLNPAMDCGCFGEAVHLSHGQTFIKNVILCALASYAFLPLPSSDGKARPIGKYVFGTLSVITVGIAVYSLFFLPLWDFTAFSAGDRLYDISNPFPPLKQSEPGFIYEKEGVRQEFSLNDLPDSTWTFVSEAEMPAPSAPANLIPVSAPDGAVCDSVLLHGKIMAVSVYDDLSLSRWSSTARFLAQAAGSGFRPVLLTALSPEGFESAMDGLSTEDRLGLLMVTYYSDHKALMTFNRSNGGAVLLDEGLIADKWSAYSLPSSGKMQILASSHPGRLFIRSSVPGRLVLSVFMVFAILISLYTHRKK